MDEIDHAVAALKRHLEAATTDPEIAAVPLLVERIERFAPLLVPERPEADELGRVVQSLIIARAYLCELANDPRLTEADRARAQELEVVFAGVRVDDDASERTMRDIPWTKQGQARKAAKARGAGSPTRKAVEWALAALERGEHEHKSSAALAAALLFGANVDSVLRALRPSKLR
jgi:hypothetical protein